MALIRFCSLLVAVGLLVASASFARASVVDKPVVLLGAGHAGVKQDAAPSLRQQPHVASRQRLREHREDVSISAASRKLLTSGRRQQATSRLAVSKGRRLDTASHAAPASLAALPVGPVFDEHSLADISSAAAVRASHSSKAGVQLKASSNDGSLGATAHKLVHIAKRTSTTARASPSNGNVRNVHGGVTRLFRKSHQAVVSASGPVEATVILAARSSRTASGKKNLSGRGNLRGRAIRIAKKQSRSVGHGRRAVTRSSRLRHGARARNMEKDRSVHVLGPKNVN